MLRCFRRRRRRRCPQCGGRSVKEIISSVHVDQLEQAKREVMLYPVRPAPTFECDRCRYRWENPAFVRYLLSRAVHP